MANRVLGLAVVGIILCASGSAKAGVGDVRCMPQALGYVTEAFEKARAAGLTVNSPEGEVALGSNVNVESVEIKDIHKASFRVRINLYSVDGRITDSLLDTTIHDFDYETCSIREESLSQLEHLRFRFFPR